MWKIDTADASSTEPARPAAGALKFFVNPTIVPPWWLNMVQNELYNVLVRFGVTPSKTSDTQIADAIQGYVDGERIDMKTVQITGHPSGISHTAAGTWTYNIADFVGTGLDVSKIRSIFIYLNTICYNGRSITVQATYPWAIDSLVNVNHQYTHGNNGDARQDLGQLFEIPVNGSQTYFKMSLAHNSSATLSIVAATMVGKDL